MGRIRALLRRRIVTPVVEQLKQGITPSRLALSLAFGVVLSSMPFLGFTGAICALVAFALRLNQPAILAANYAATPLQVALFVPFFRAGSWLFGVEATSLSFEGLRTELNAGFLPTMSKYGGANLRAMAVFVCVAPFALGLLYLLFLQVLSRLPLPRPPSATDGAPAPATPAE